MQPSGGGPSASTRDNLVVRSFNLFFGEMSEPPKLLRVEAIVRSGTPRRIPFTLPDITLPDAGPLAQVLEGAGDSDTLLQPGHPLYAEPGGTIALPVKRASGTPEGRLVVGLSRVTGGMPGAWRWLEPALGEDSRALLLHVRPGRYRLVREWLREGESPAPPRGGIEIEVTAERSVSAPTFVVEQRR